MCGIVGYIGNKQAQPILLDSLSRMEYRGYDSCGIAIGGSSIETYKDAVRIEALRNVSPLFDGVIGIGHTRWATHGEPSQINAHPHADCSGNITVVHNGVITNFHTLRHKLISEGHIFASETDTEVLSHLIEKYYRGDIEEAVRAALTEVEGSYAIIVLAARESKLIVARKDSPLVIGLGNKENLIASDVPAILEYTNRIIYLEDGDIGVITGDSVEVTTNRIGVNRKEHIIDWGREDISKDGYEHFMLKEIHEQPRVIRDSLMDDLPTTETVMNSGLTFDGGMESLTIVACGTSYYAGLIGKYIIEELIGIPVKVELASEFNHSRRVIPSTGAIALTQSGETADVLSAIRRLRKSNIETLVITNVMSSTASRLADHTLYTTAGPEVSVASTKTFIAQLTMLYQLVILSGSGINRRIRESLVAGLRQLPAKIQKVLDNKDQIITCARYLSKYDNVFFVGRGINVPIALEGALKLKEIAYIRAEGYAAGELKHGPLALLGRDTPVIAIATRDNTYDVLLTNIKEMKARNAPVIALAEETDGVIGEFADSVIRIPDVTSLFSPMVNAVTLQLLAYYTALQRGCPIDFPRNLAKSVTVE